MQTVAPTAVSNDPSGLPATIRVGLLCAMIPFILLTAAAVWQHGYLGIFLLQFQNLASTQVLVDLCIALTMVLVWMWSDAKRTRRAFLPWALLTLVAGSFGPLFYLLFSEPKR